MIKIRRMKSQDVRAIYNLGREEARFKVGENGGFWTIEQLTKWAKSKNDVLLVAEKDSRIIGCALSHYHPPTRKATFENLYVNPEYRGQSIGDELTSKLISALNEKGAKYICALVEPDNRSIIKLLGRNGFRKGKQMIWMDKAK